MLSLPPELARPVQEGAHVLCKVMLDLTVYLVGPSEAELEFLFDLYDSFCPADRRTQYTLAELPGWTSVSYPHVTDSVRDAAAAGRKRPYIEPARKRIREGRGFEVGFWDGRSIDDMDGSWSFNCRRIHRRTSGLHAFVRLLMPLETDVDVLKQLASSIAERVELYSGHAGLAFVYDPWAKDAAFDAIYALARRFWGVDVEDLNATLLLMKQHIKGVNWITLVGEGFKADVTAGLSDLQRDPAITVHHAAHAAMLVAGARPVSGDRNRLDPGLDCYFTVARALAALFPDTHPDFSGERFADNDNTLGWVRRFIEPSGW